MAGNLFGQTYFDLDALGVAKVETFDSLGSNAAAILPPGFKVGVDWSTASNVTTRSYGTLGTNAVTSSSSGGFINWANGTNQSVTERALGILNTGSFGSPRTIVLAISNNSGTTLDTLDLAWNYEKYRSGTRAWTWTFKHGDTSVPANTAPAGDLAYPGDAANTTIFNPPQATSRSVKLSNLNIPAGALYYLSWTLTGTGGSSNGQGLAIDDLSVTASRTMTPALALSVPASLDEGVFGQWGLVSIPAAIGTDLMVAVTSSNPSVLEVGWVWIPAGETSGLFFLTPIADNQVTPDHLVTLTAEAPGFETASASITVKNVDLPRAEFGTAGYATDFSGFTNSVSLPLGWSISGISVSAYSEWIASTSGTKYSSTAPFVFGYRHTGSTGTVLQTLTLSNSTSETITALFVDYLARAYTNSTTTGGTTTVDGRDPAYAVTVAGQVAVDLGYSTSEGDRIAKSALVPDLNIPPGGVFAVVWSSDGPSAPGSGSRKTIGLSDVRVATTPLATPPTITSPNAFSGTVGALFSGTITATGNAPIAFVGTGLPGGLLVATNGAITGTPTEAGTFAASLTAINGAGMNSQAVSFTIAKGTPTIFTAPISSPIPYGQTLGSSMLAGGTANTVGTFAWATPSTVPPVGVQILDVIFTPADLANYQSITTSVSVTVLAPSFLILPNQAGGFGTLAGMAGMPGSTDGEDARFSSPRGVATDVAGNIYVADTSNHTIRKIAPNGSVSTVAGTAGQGGSADGTGGAARFRGPRALAAAADGTLYVADTDNHLIRKISPAGEVTTLAGAAGQRGSQDGVGAAARFARPMGITVDWEGNVYVADTGNHTIRKISPDGTVMRVAGQSGSDGATDGDVSVSRLSSPLGLAAAPDGSVWVADSNNFLLRKLTGTTLSTVAGAAGQSGAADGTGGAARLVGPTGVAVDAAGNAYFSEAAQHFLRKCTPAGVVTRWAGQPNAPGSTDGAWDQVKFYRPSGLAVDRQGNLIVADTGNHSIRAGWVATVDPVLARLQPRPAMESTLPVPVADLILDSDPSGVTMTASTGFEVRPTSDPGKFTVWTSGSTDYELGLFMSFRVTLRKGAGTPTTLSCLVTMLDDRNEDADGDGLPEWQEEDVYGISDTKKDSDNDGVNDPVEIADGTDPKNPASFNRLSQDLVAYYAFSGNAKDISGGGNSGQVIDCAFGEDRNGITNQALRLNQAGSRVVVPSSENLQIGTSDLTLTAWIKCDGFMVDRYFISKYYGSGAGYGLGTGQNGGPYAFLGREGANALDWRGGNDFNDGAWHFLAASYDRDGQLRIFVDGKPVPVAGSEVNGVAIGSYGADIRNAAPLLIGRHEGGTSFRGWIDEVRIYRRALDPADVGALYLRDAGILDQDGDGLTDAWEQGYGRYQTVSGDWTWAQAREDAESRGGHLATLTTLRENRFVMEMLGLNFPVGQYGWWVGGTGGADPWSWITGEAWAYENWHPRGEPNNPRDRNYFLLLQPDGSWDDWEGRIGYLLEFGYPTDPFKADTDGDGFNDHEETVAGTDPNDAAENPDFRQPFIVAQPQSITAAAGSSATFTVQAMAPGPNALRNSNFEESTNFWNANGGQIRTTPGGYAGENSLQLTANGGYGRLRYVQDLAMEAGVSYLATALGRGAYPTSNHSFDLWIGLLGGDTQMVYQELPRVERSRNGFTWSTVRTLATSPSGALRNLNLLHFSPFGESSEIVDLVQWRRCSTEGLTYQWKKDGQNIPGANGPQLNFATLQSGQAGNYQVVVSSPYGSVTSEAATLQVGLDPAADEDGDGLTNGQELTLGTSPYQKDSDNDGVNDPVEIADNTNPNDGSSFNQLSRGLVAFYPFNGNANDRSGNGRHLTVFGPTQAEGRKRFQGDLAYDFREGDYLLGFQNVGIVGNSARTFSLWVRVDPTTRTSQLMGYGPNFGAGGFISLDYDGVSSPNAVTSLRMTGNYRDALFMGRGYFQESIWQHVVLTYAGSLGSTALYVNGASAVNPSFTNGNQASDILATGDGPLLIGKGLGSGILGTLGLVGQMDDVRIYDRALSSAEVAELYAAEVGNMDSDGDGFTDLIESHYASDPNDPSVTPNTVRPAGRLAVWGTSEYVNSANIPVAAGGTNLISLDIGDAFTTVLRNDGQVVTWGMSSFNRTAVPPEIQGKVVEISSGFAHTVALLGDGTVATWGYGGEERLDIPANLPVGIVAISAGNTHNLALTHDGRVVAWGDSRNQRNLVPPDASTNVQAISVGDYHSMVLTRFGEVKVWRDASPFHMFGQTNVPAAARTNVVQIAAGLNHCLALTKDGQVLAWGWNEYGQATVPPAAQSGVRQIFASFHKSTAIKTNGEIITWGLTRPPVGIPSASFGILAAMEGGEGDPSAYLIGAALVQEVADAQPPLITLIGANPLEVYKGATFTDPGATLTDNVDANRTITGSGTVDTATVGIYTLTYTAQDAAGNLAVPVIRTVNVVLDPAADEDGDGLTNGQELTLGTSPYHKDSDNDGVNDPVEIADNTNPNNPASFNQMSQGLVAYYPFNGNTGDGSGNGHRGVLVNSTVTETGISGAGNSLRINGAMDSWMEVQDSPMLRPRGFTLSMWIYNNLSDNRGVRYVCGKNYEQMEIHLSNDVNPESGVRFIPSNGCYVDSLVGTPASQWFHLVCLAGEGSDGGKIYINGTEVPVNRFGPVSGALPINLGSDPFYLGRRTENGWPHLDGRMDNVRVYGRILSASEIRQLYVAEAGNLDTDGDGLTDAWEQGYGRYQIVSGNFITWEQARMAAEAQGGHLATITSEAEFQTIRALVPAFGDESLQPWLGAVASNYDQDWVWITGEAWGYTRWQTGEPSYGGQPYLWSGYLSSNGEQRWDNIENNPFGTPGRPVPTGYLVEFGYPTDPTRADTDGDGFDDKTESLAGTDPNDAIASPVITLAGNFQGWAPTPTPQNTMQPVPGNPDTRQLDWFFPAVGTYQIKFTTGEWGRLDWGFSGTPGLAQAWSGNIPVEITTPGWWRFSFNPITLAYGVSKVPELDSDGDGLSDAWESGEGRYVLVGPPTVPASGGVHWGLPGNFTWFTAKADAEARGGHLATITSEEEWQNIVFRLGADQLYDRSILIGLSDASQEGTWQWVTGETVGHTRWRWLTGEPNGGTTENYVCLPYERFSFGEWVDIGLGEISYYLLEYGYPTNPYNADTDGDGFDDRMETLAGTDPNNPASNAGVITIAGSFQGWAPTPTPENTMQPVPMNPDLRQLDWFFPTAGLHEMKFTLGDWNRLHWGASGTVGLAQPWGNNILVGISAPGWWRFTFNIRTLSYGITKVPQVAITSLQVRAHIDGPSQLILSPQGIRWRHWDWTAVPGRHEGRDEPTYLNGVAWLPTWPQPGENRNYEAFSSYNTDYDLSAFLVAETVTLSMAQARDSVIITREPSGDVVLTIINYDDLGWPGSADYDVTITANGLFPLASTPTSSGGTTPPAPVPANLDSDGDGQTDAMELAAGTDPNNANSRFTLSLSPASGPALRTLSTASTSSPTGQVMVLTWSSVPGKVYEIQKSTDLRNWSTIGRIDAEPAPATQTSAEVSAPDPKAFYRVGVP